MSVAAGVRRRGAGGPRSGPPYIDLDLRRVLLACPLACLCPASTHSTTGFLILAFLRPLSCLPHDAISSIHGRR